MNNSQTALIEFCDLQLVLNKLRTLLKPEHLTQDKIEKFEERVKVVAMESWLEISEPGDIDLICVVKLPKNKTISGRDEALSIEFNIIVRDTIAECSTTIH